MTLSVMIIADAILMVLSFAALVFASVIDVRTKEVPDWISYSLIVSCFGVRVFYFLVFRDLWYLLYGLIGFASMLVFGLVMYYTKQWGGGDAKLAMGLGIAFSSNLFSEKSFLFGFIVNLLIFGAFYGIGWSVYLAFKNKKGFAKSFAKNLNEKKRFRIFSLILGFLAVVSIFFISSPLLRFVLCITALTPICYTYFHVFGKSVEECCMYKWLPVSRLTEGDWVAKPVYMKGKLICGPKDVGLEKCQIIALKKADVKKVLVKEGIPFVPSFLIASIVTLVYGNILLSFI